MTEPTMKTDEEMKNKDKEIIGRTIISRAIAEMRREGMGKVEIIDYMKSAIDSDLGAGWFNVEVVFQSLDDAFAAKQEFLDAGYLFEILFDRIDVYSNAAFVAVSRPTGTATLYELFDEASEFAWRLGGMADCASITPEPDTDTAGMAGKAS